MCWVTDTKGHVLNRCNPAFMPDHGSIDPRVTSWDRVESCLVEKRGMRAAFHDSVPAHDNIRTV